MSAPENPQAFPTPSFRPSMTLRDWFAGQVLAGLMANADMPFAADYAEVQPAQIASAAYDLADAMLAERAKAVS